MKLSEKQQTIIDYIREHGQATKQELIPLVNTYFHNASKHVGDLLSNMVKRGYIKRVKPGVFELGGKSNSVPVIVDKDQTRLF